MDGVKPLASWGVAEPKTDVAAAESETLVSPTAGVGPMLKLRADMPRPEML